MVKSRSYKVTFIACMLGIFNQAAVCNITALLFVPFMNLYGFGLWQLGVLIGVNFCSQLLADLILTAKIETISYRKMSIMALILASSGLIIFALVSPLMARWGSGAVFASMAIATVIFSFSGGMLEVLVTPITHSIPDSKSKSGAVALMHSFYAWGQVITIIVTALFIALVGEVYWPIIAGFWAVPAIVGIFLFCICPIAQSKSNGEQKSESKEKPSHKFTPYLVIAMIAIFTAGGTEMIMNQYVSTFCTISLGFSKTISDLVGMCLFAVMMGIGRTTYGILGDRLDMHAVLISGSIASCGCYIVVGLVPNAIAGLICCIACGLFASLLWPGTLVIAGKRFTTNSAWVFAVLAISGDLGGSIIPSTMGVLADFAGLNIAFALFSIVPLVCFIANLILRRKDKKDGIGKLLPAEKE
ncbi:MAG: MFS transporter [Clostridia bacterium]|nr:MFS transporter [Clostridia bacterium]